MKSPPAKILLLDIETAPNIGFTWGTWEQNVIKVIREWHILCCAVKWLGERGKVLSLTDYPLYKRRPYDDRLLVKDILKYLDEADIVIAHNGDAFDFKKINARIFFHNLKPPSPYQTIDTLKLARRHFSFTSNKLNDLSQFLNLGKKVDTHGFLLWEKCLAGDRKAWKKMKRYNLHDVVLLEKVYLHFRPWAKTHPTVTPEKPKTDYPACPRCKSTHVQARGYMISRTGKSRKLQCQDCGGWLKAPLDPKKQTISTT